LYPYTTIVTNFSLYLIRGRLMNITANTKPDIHRKHTSISEKNVV
jgi:hypothetical protein